ncbi:BNR repeat-containing glycosyl hydrolase [Pseudomonas saudimassiliensis]|uniref:BNR repeat-containing glycosyl hydrolase n=1 Tax=Pseudomonas saudimassiliensis TaxID=1461581 RepID=A0A078MLC2_9PSED|nr:sialidase family protein [Pseudomonas saudimassiliensis]CEA06187.1 BNR repeat-containing glycosyl hydrolase [Pseudomonas saudimassiliensis]CEF27612.1 BNR repeat-containing glycosyl hydrolase [Pseudomonas saudimassiliensis]
MHWTTIADRWRLLAIPVVLAVFVAAWVAHPAYQMADFSAFPAAGFDTTVVSQEADFEQGFASSDLHDFVHSPSVAALPGGDLMAAWFAGSREGAADVEIRGARYDAISGVWGDEEILVTREMTRRAIGKPIRKLGNPVIAFAPDQRLWLFYVSVSVGGWAGSAVNAMVSDDLGVSWSKPRQLVTTPFVNISTLVRTAPVFHADGSIGLPVYHEFLGKFPEYLYMDAEGRVIDKFRIADGTNSLQPTVVPLSPKRAVALLRQAGDEGHVLATVTEDAGRTWQPEREVAPWNPNTSLAAVRSAAGSLLVAQNNLIDGRFNLSLDETTESLSEWSLVTSLDASPDPWGKPFPQLRYKELLSEKFLTSSGLARQSLLDEYLNEIDQRMCRNGMCDFEYEYPYMIRATDGRYHLVYAWNNSFIKHVAFNDAWLEAQL